MLAFQPYDTNNVRNSQKLGLSPPAKPCNISPSKVPFNGDMLFYEDSCSEDSQGKKGSSGPFKFSLSSVPCTSQSKASVEKPNQSDRTNEGGEPGWQKDLMGEINSFE